MFKYTIGIAVAVAFWFTPMVSYAQADCGSYELIKASLKSRWNEQVIGRGLLGNQMVLEFWANLDTGGWTAVQVMPDGRGCVVASGTDWNRVVPKPNT